MYTSNKRLAWYGIADLEEGILLAVVEVSWKCERGCLLLELRRGKVNDQLTKTLISVKRGKTILLLFRTTIFNYTPL